MATRCFTRRFTPVRSTPHLWLVLVGDQCLEHWVEMQIPDEHAIRMRLGLGSDVPILIGRP